MSDNLFSASWYRVCSLKPKLADHVNLYRHDYQGEIQYILQDVMSDKYFRFNTVAYDAIAQLNGQKTIDDIWTELNEKFGDDAPTQDEMIQILSQLYQANALRSQVMPDIQDMKTRQERHKSQKLLMRVKNPMAMRFKVLNPNELLERITQKADFLLNIKMLVLSVSFILICALLACMHWVALGQQMHAMAFETKNLLLIALIYPVVKLLHELGHGIAGKKLGANIYEFGIMFLVFMPMPYVNASESTTFRNKYHRVLVDSAGILVELGLASIALIVWLLVEPGLIKNMAFNVMLIGGVSTLLFNGNPLLRYDGYYILSDWIETPNLAKRSNAYLGYLFKRYVLRLDEPSIDVSRKEQWIFPTYAVASYFYRLFILLFIAKMLIDNFFFFGVALAIWAGFSQFIQPIYKNSKKLLENPRFHKRKKKVVGIISGCGLSMALLLGVVPVSVTTVAEGVIWLPETSIVRAQQSGFIEKVYITHEMQVPVDHQLMRIYNPDLISEIKILKEQYREQKIEISKATSENDWVKKKLLEEDMQKTVADINNKRDKLKKSTVLSHEDGRFISISADALQGQHVKKGQTLGYILSPTKMKAKVMIEQSEIGLIRAGVKTVELRVAGHHQTLETKILRQTPNSSNQLPSSVLGSEGGGVITLSPKHENGLLASQHYFEVEVDIPEQWAKAFIGKRVYTKFNHAPKPLIQQWYRKAKQLLLRNFNV